MRVFHCDRCGSVVPFAAQRCRSCGAALGYVSEQRTIRVLLQTADPVVFEVAGLDHTFWRCLNTAWGCNWLTSPASGNEWCRSCSLTRGRPDEARGDAIDAWMIAESAKRRLLHQLDELSLPVEIRSASVPDGLAFDLVYLPGEGGITGHLDGIITLDLAEVDDGYRDELRRRLGEPFRTVIGHLRHEIGHRYWGRLVGQTNHTSQFRRLFGDDSIDYQEAIERYYRGEHGPWDRERFVSPYAASHPLEDWAETFAHYLHIVDATDTAIAHHLVPPDRSERLAVAPDPVAEFHAILAAWRPASNAVNAIAETLGVAAVYPFDPSGVVVDKLAFVHQQVTAHAERSRFYAGH